MSNVQVIIFDNASNKSQQKVFATGTTVATALMQTGIATDGCEVRVNREVVSLDHVLADRDRVSIVRTDVKGAVESFGEILAASTKTSCDKVPAATINEAAKNRETDRAKAEVDAMRKLMAEADAALANEKATVAVLAEQVAEAKKRYDSFVYCYEQLQAGNVCAYYAFFFDKQGAADFYRQIDKPVPDADCDCWSTTPPEADAPADSAAPTA